MRDLFFVFSPLDTLEVPARPLTKLHQGCSAYKHPRFQNIIWQGITIYSAYYIGTIYIYSNLTGLLLCFLIVSNHYMGVPVSFNSNSLLWEYPEAKFINPGLTLEMRIDNFYLFLFHAWIKT